MSQNSYDLIDNYIYLFHTDEWLLIPQFPDSLSDKLPSTFASQNALSRTAPIFAYSNSGPRSINVNLTLHRDMIQEMNTNVSNMKVEIGDDYVDTLIKKLQAIALPRYSASNKSVNPPMIAVRFGEDIFIKGIVNGGISIEYQAPILSNNKYAVVSINFVIYETQPFDADSVSQLGSFRGITQQFKNGIYKSDED